MKPFLLVAILVLISQASLAQGGGVYRAPRPRPPPTAGTLERDPATGNYLLSYTDEDGNSYTVQVEAADRVVFDLGVNVSADTAYTTISYSYQLKNRATPTTGARIGSLILQCDDPDAKATSTQWFADVTLVRVLAARKCEFLGSRRFRLSSGALLSDAKITSRWLPGIDKVIVGGEVDPPVWPSGQATPKAASKLARTVNSEYLGGQRVDMLAPLKDPTSFAVPDRGLGLVLADLEQACKLDWIAKKPCRSLQKELREAQAALLRNALEDAVDAMRDVQEKLKEQDVQEKLKEHEKRGKPEEKRERPAKRDDEDDEHISHSAVALLGTNVNYVLFQLCSSPQAPEECRDRHHKKADKKQ
jgi:hypothetical protein